MTLAYLMCSSVIVGDYHGDSAEAFVSAFDHTAAEALRKHLRNVRMKDQSIRRQGQSGFWNNWIEWALSWCVARA